MPCLQSEYYRHCVTNVKKNIHSMFNLGIWNSNWNKSIRMWPHFHFDHRSVCVNHEFAALECQDLVQNCMRELWFCFRFTNRSAPNLVMINLTNQVKREFQDTQVNPSFKLSILSISSTLFANAFIHGIYFLFTLYSKRVQPLFSFWEGDALAYSKKLFVPMITIISIDKWWVFFLFHEKRRPFPIWWTE